MGIPDAAPDELEEPRTKKSIDERVIHHRRAVVLTDPVYKEEHAQELEMRRQKRRREAERQAAQEELEDGQRTGKRRKRKVKDPRDNLRERAVVTVELPSSRKEAVEQKEASSQSTDSTGGSILCPMQAICSIEHACLLCNAKFRVCSRSALSGPAPEWAICLGCTKLFCGVCASSPGKLMHILTCLSK